MSRLGIMSNKRKQKNKRDLLIDVQQFVCMGLNMVITIYMFLVIAVMPFYFTDGYTQIGTDKHDFLYNITTGMGVIFLPLFLGWLLVTLCIFVKSKMQGQVNVREFLKKITITDWFVLAYGLVLIISYLLSDYKEMGDYGNALEGTERWYMGLLTQLILVSVYFAVSRFWKKNKWLPALWLPVTLVVFVLGYLNRFDVRPIEMRNATPEFISTIGNINWYCGYIVIIFFGILYYVWTQTEQKMWVKIIFGVWITLGFATLLTQGSRSGFVALAVAVLGLYLFSMKQQEKMQALFTLLMSMGIACVVTCGIRKLFPERFNYSDAIVDLLTDSPMALALLGIVLVIRVVLVRMKKEGKFPERFFTTVGYVGCGVIVLSLMIFVGLGVKNTLQPGSIGALSDFSPFIFEPEWGSNRGATWVAGWMCFANQDFLGKLFGVGPDCMAMYIHSGVDSELLAMVQEAFGSLLLTNAHNEWLTILVTCGFLGMISYAGLMISAMVRYLKAGIGNPLAGACGFAILAYTVNNMFSFQQSMSAITIFLVLGMGEAYMRKKE